MEEYRLQTNDLIQQTRAASAAEEQADIAGQTLWTSWFQTIGGLVTLAAAIAAAWYARDAANQSKRGAVAAEVAIEGTQRTSEAQARAYLSVVCADITIDPTKRVEGMLPEIEVYLHLSNSGGTPAVNVSYHCRSGVSTWGQIETLPKTPIAPQHEFIPNVPPGNPRKTKVTCYGVARDWREVQKRWSTFNNDTPIGEAPILLIYGSVFYEDVFGQTFRSEFGFWLEEQPMPGRKPAGGADLPPLQSRFITFERIGDRADYVGPAVA